VLLLARPIAHVRTHTLGPWDGLAHSSGYLAREPVPIGNSLLSDPVRQMLPWVQLARAELAEGRLPLWNERNGTGVPLLANYQSALLSPFTWPHYVLGPKLATLVSAFARLACAAAGAYLFLRICAFAPVASAFGSVTYAASAGQLMLLLHPHSGVTALMPWVLLGIERTIQAGKEAESRRLVRASAGLAVAAGLSGLAGHPEMLLATAVIGSLYALARLAAARPRRSARIALALLGAAVAAGAIAAPQILPFAEYLQVSWVREQPTRFEAVLDPRNLALLCFPNLAGTPIGCAEFAPGIVTPNYQEQTIYYVGALPLLCALAALGLGVLRTRFALFAVLVPALAAVVWNVGGLGDRLGPLVSLGLIPVGRFYSIWSIAVAVLAAWLVQRLMRDRGRARAAAALGAWALAFYAAARWGAQHFLSSYAAELGLDLAQWRAFAAEHRAWIGAWYWAGVLALWALALARSTKARWAAAVALCAVQVIMTAGIVGHYVPLTPDRYVPPRTPELAALRSIVGAERLLFFGRDGIPADANAILGLSSMMHYDAIGIGDVQFAAAPIFGAQSYAAEVHKATSAALRVFGVRYVSTRSDWLPIGTLSELPTGEHFLTPYLRLLNSRDKKPPDIEVDAAGVRQVITVPRDGLSSLVVHLRPDAQALASRIEIALHDTDDSLVARRELKLGDLRHLHAERMECVLAFPPIADSAGRSFAVAVRALDPQAPRVRLRSVPHWWARFQALGASHSAEPNGAPRAKQFLADLGFDAAFIDRGDIGEHSLFELAGSRGRAWIVAGVLAVADRVRARQILASPDFDPYKHVLLEGAFADRAPEPDLAAALEPLYADPQRSRWRARVDRPAFLVFAHPHYPGWVARLDGREVPLLHANCAFCAVELPEGEHEVELTYEPRSVRTGFAFALLGWLGVVVTWLWTR
jgi:hypothetical protein